MNNIHKSIFACLTLGLLVGIVQGQSSNPNDVVWPGDINNNGIVDHVDILYLGNNIGLQGPGRDSTSTAWIGQEAPSTWGTALASDVSISFADCDGNGAVETTDANAIFANYGEQHDSLFANFFEPANNGTADLRFGQIEGVITPNATYAIPITLSGSNMPIDDFYGIAFSIFVNPTYINPTQMELAFNGWLDTGDAMLEFQRLSDDLVRYDVSLSRLFQSTTDGTGKIGTLYIVIEGDLPGFTGEDEILEFGEIYLVDQLLRRTEVEGHSLVADFVSSTAEPSSVPNFEIYPNPIRHGSFRINGINNELLQTAQLYDITGRQVEVKIQAGDISTSHLPYGTYFLEISDEQGNRHIEKLLITR